MEFLKQLDSDSGSVGDEVEFGCKFPKLVVREGDGSVETIKLPAKDFSDGVPDALLCEFLDGYGVRHGAVGSVWWGEHIMDGMEHASGDLEDLSMAVGLDGPNEVIHVHFHVFLAGEICR